MKTPQIDSITIAPPAQARPPTFTELIALEPRLSLLIEDAQRARVRPDEVNALWYGYGAFWGRGLKSKLCGLVGFTRIRKGPTEEQFRAAVQAARERAGRWQPVALSELPSRPLPPADDPEILYSSEAYDVAYNTILDALVTGARRREECV
jgi:hypothetical protein